MEPGERPTLTAEEKTAQRQLQSMLTRLAMPSVDMFALDHSSYEYDMARATWHRLLVEAAIGALLAEGLITATVPDEPGWLKIGLPEHLLPFVQACRLGCGHTPPE